MKDLNKLKKEVFEANKLKGFHEEHYSIKHMLCLVISELMEAVEADRKGRIANINTSNIEVKLVPGSDKFKDYFEKFVKDTVEDELADSVIRLLDTAGSLDITLDLFDCKHKHLSKNFTENIYEIVFVMMSYNENYCISYAIDMIEGLCVSMGIDLWKHIELKLKYNSLRPYKHGKKY